MQLSIPLLVIFNVYPTILQQKMCRDYSRYEAEKTLEAITERIASIALCHVLSTDSEYRSIK